MKTYTVKYETFDGEVKAVKVTAYLKKDVIYKLINCKEIYWIE